MKKLFTYLMVGAFFGSAANAQTLFSEDFDGIGGSTAGGPGTYAFPAGWVLINADARTPNAAVAYVNEAWERREDLGNVGDSAAYSTSWYTPVGASNDWMWTPPIALTSNNVLRWNAKAQDAAYPDGYEVRIWTAGGTPTAVTTASTVLFATAAEASTWTSRTVNLQTLGYTNQTVRIGFRNISNDMFLLLIDDIEVITQTNYDVELTQQKLNSEYTIVPFSQLQAVSGTGTIRNNGLLAASNVNLEVDVYDGTPAIIATVPATAVTTMAPAASLVFNTAAITPPAVADFYQFDFNAVMTQMDMIPANNYLPEVPYMIVDPAMYARDNGDVTGTLGIGAEELSYLGNAFDIYQTTYLDSIMYYVDRGYTGRPTSAVVWSTVGGVPNAIIGSTPVINYANDDPAVITLGMLNGPLLLNPGEYVVTAVEYDSTIALGTTTGIFTPGKTWVNWPSNPNGTWSNSEDFGFNVSYVIRMILNDNPVGVSTVISNPSETKVYPNPSNGSFTIEVAGQEGMTLLQITDMTGRVVYTESVLMTNEFRKDLNLNLVRGSYLLSLISNDSANVQKLTID